VGPDRCARCFQSRAQLAGGPGVVLVKAGDFDAPRKEGAQALGVLAAARAACDAIPEFVEHDRGDGDGGALRHRAAQPLAEDGRLVLEEGDDRVCVEQVAHANRSSGSGIGGCWRPSSMKGTSAKRSSSANQVSRSVTIGSSRMPPSTRRTRTRSPGRRKARGRRTAWLRPCMKILAMPESAMLASVMDIHP